MHHYSKLARGFALLLTLAAISLMAGKSWAYVEVVAEAYPTPSVEGFTTYDLIVRTNEGYINGYDFVDINGSGRGITGSFRQVGGAYTQQLDDSGWLVDRSVGLDLGVLESESELRGAFVFTGVGGFTDTYTTLPLARLVTDDPSQIAINGQLLIEPFNSTAFDAEIHEVFNVSTLLSAVRLVPEPGSAALILTAALAGALAKPSRSRLA